MGGCVCAFHIAVVSETIFELGDVGTSTLMYSFVTKQDGTTGYRKTIRIQEQVCKNCGKQQQVYLKNKPLKGWKVEYDRKYTMVDGVLYKKGTKYNGKCTILDEVPSGGC